MGFVPSVSRSPTLVDCNSLMDDEVFPHLGQSEGHRQSASYEAGFEAAIVNLRELMQRGRQTPNMRAQTHQQNGGREDVSLNDMDISNSVGVENLGSASAGLPTSTSISLDSPFVTPPDTNVFSPGTYAWEMKPELANFYSAGVADRCSSPDTWVTDSSDQGRRADYALHMKVNDGSKFIIKTDAGGNIVTNKLRVTWMVKRLMRLYVDVAQIHYKDTDEKFLLVEQIVRSKFDFQPPLCRKWFSEFMRKHLERSRYDYRRHWDETGKIHPACPKDKHPALQAWWSSPSGSSRSHRMKEINEKRATERLAQSVVGNSIMGIGTSMLHNNVLVDSSQQRQTSVVCDNHGPAHPHVDAHRDVNVLKKTVADILSSLYSVEDLPIVKEKVQLALNVKLNAKRSSAGRGGDSLSMKNYPTNNLPSPAVSVGNENDLEDVGEVNGGSPDVTFVRKRTRELIPDDQDTNTTKTGGVTNSVPANEESAQVYSMEKANVEAVDSGDNSKKVKVTSETVHTIGQGMPVDKPRVSGANPELNVSDVGIGDTGTPGNAADGVLQEQARVGQPTKEITERQALKKKSKFMDGVPPSELAPKGHQGMQLVEIIKVYQPGVKVMHSTKQPNKEVRTLDDVSDVEFAEDSLVMWGTDYLVEVAPRAQKGKTK
ncbi:hypothetical protein KC19_VG217000 [Ceratodon purpureus]|uniref:Uncharacterized protein n=1 Tax=Ceratodon purpureus TaxID=3225 RepID=A0A8T0HSY8_CERPU|nr:hypothetical protein KC19_VG217000 [Ceratodon purpureus]